MGCTVRLYLENVGRHVHLHLLNGTARLIPVTGTLARGPGLRLLLQEGPQRLPVLHDQRLKDSALRLLEHHVEELAVTVVDGEGGQAGLRQHGQPLIRGAPLTITQQALQQVSLGLGTVTWGKIKSS